MESITSNNYNQSLNITSYSTKKKSIIFQEYEQEKHKTNDLELPTSVRKSHRRSATFSTTGKPPRSHSKQRRILDIYNSTPKSPYYHSPPRPKPDVVPLTNIMPSSSMISARKLNFEPASSAYNICNLDIPLLLPNLDDDIEGDDNSASPRGLKLLPSVRGHHQE